MGKTQSSVTAYEDIAEDDYEGLHRLRSEVFSDNYSNETWRNVILKDFVSSAL